MSPIRNHNLAARGGGQTRPGVGCGFEDWIGHDGACGYAPTPALDPDARGPGFNEPLAGLAGSSMADRFRSWTGRSGRRCVFSIFPIETSLDGVPTGSAAVVIAVERDRAGRRRPLWIAETGASPEAFYANPRVIALAGRAGIELHLHLLTSGEADRRALVADLNGA